MALTENVINAYTAILKEELIPAMGCTEPIAIAYAASILRDALGEEPARITACLSGNIIKNVKSVIVPATGGQHGIAAAIAAGVIANAPEKKLQVLTGLTESDHCRIRAYVEKTPIEILEYESPYPFDLLLSGRAGENTVRVKITHRHTNVVLLERNGEDLLPAYFKGEMLDCSAHFREGSEGNRTDRSLLSVREIVEYADTVPLFELRPILTRQIEMNLAIAEEGLHGDYGASIGRVIFKDGSVSLRDRARAYAAAGSDARMSGCELPVCILSGSGNQGITASVPVLIYALDIGASEEEILRALIVSNLITIHQKTGIGCLSAYCGAISAGCGAGAGICYLFGGRFYEIAHTLVNAIAILSGTICDGAKPSCAAKIAMAVEAGILGYDMMKAGKQFYGGDGIVTKGVENTIRNVGKLAREGMSETDKEIIRIMLGDEA